MGAKPSVTESIIYVDPNSVGRCTPASDTTDMNQYDGNRNHPHAALNRGYFFEENRAGMVLDGEWDTWQSPRFDELLEFIAIKEHVIGFKQWRDSEFCVRSQRAIKQGFHSKGFLDPQEFVEVRSRQIDELLQNISRSGVHPANDLFDNISVNVDRAGEFLFNNRGHHRLAIAKCLNLASVPVLVVVTHKEFAGWKR